MKCYEYVGPGDVGEEGMYEHPDGEYVLYKDAQAEIERLRAALNAIEDVARGEGDIGNLVARLAATALRPKTAPPVDNHES